MIAEALVVSMVLLPLLLAALLFIAPEAWRNRLGQASTLLCALLTLLLAWQVLDGGTIRVALGGWQPPLGIGLRADGLAVIMLSLSALIALPLAAHAPSWFACHEKAHGRAGAWFWPLWFFQWGALSLIFLAADLFNAYVGLELSGLAAVALVALGGKRAALEAALRYLLLALFGSMLYLLGVALLYGAGGMLDLALLGNQLQADHASKAALLLITLGLLIKGALLPFHFWLPAAHANSPAPVSAILSGLVVKASFVLLLRIWFEIFYPIGLGGAGEVLGALGIAAILWGSLQAMRQQRIKLLVAWSTVAQLGYLFLIFALAVELAWAGSVLHALSHGLAKAALFLAAGNIALALGHDQIQRLHGAAGKLPLTFFTVALAGVSLMGLPPSGGFAAKWLMLQAAIEAGRWPYVVAIIGGSLLAAGYLFPLLRHALAGTHDPRQRGEGRLLSWWLEIPPLLLASMALLLGLMALLPMSLLSGGMPVSLR